MDKSLIERKINYWSNQQELDKFNYEQVMFRYYGVFAIIIAIWIGISTLIFEIDKNDLGLVFFILFSFGFFILFIILHRLAKREIVQHNLSYMARDKQIEELYSQLNIKKDELNKRHEQIKRDLKINWIFNKLNK